MKRKGVELSALTDRSRERGAPIWRAVMSELGQEKVHHIHTTLELVLRELESRPDRPARHRDPLRFTVAVFGDPQGPAPWGWRFEGHHLSLNFTVSDGKVVSGTPSFFASNPGEVLEGPRKGQRVLAAEEDTARELIKALSDEQRTTAHGVRWGFCASATLRRPRCATRCVPMASCRSRLVHD